MALKEDDGRTALIGPGRGLRGRQVPESGDWSLAAILPGVGAIEAGQSTLRGVSWQ